MSKSEIGKTPFHKSSKKKMVAAALDSLVAGGLTSNERQITIELIREHLERIAGESDHS